MMTINNLSIKFTYFIASIYLLLAASATSYSKSFGDDFLFEIAESFSLVSRVQSTSENGLVSYWGEFHESYSNEQKRAIINYRLNRKRAGEPNTEKKGAWFVDNDLVLDFNSETLQCKTSSLQEIKDSFEFYVPEVRKSPFWQACEIPDKYDKFDDKYIVGPARLMLFIQRNRDSSYVSQNLTNIRNLPCICYYFNHPDYNFKAYYSEESLSEFLFPHPIEIEMKHKNDSDIMVVSYSEVQANSQNLPKLAITASIFDDFVFKPFDCLEAREPKAENLFETKTDSPTTKFSFEAAIETFAGNGNDLSTVPAFVAYDSALKSMHVQLFPHHLGNGLVREKQIFNFKINHKYHIKATYNLDLSSRSMIQQVEDDADETKCLVTLLMKPEGRRSLTIGELLAGADKFVYIGRAQVRGLSARLYASSVASLPFWLEQPIVYTNKYGQTDTRQPNLGAQPKAATKKPNVKQIIFLYFGEHDLNNPLLLIEIRTFDEASSVFLPSKAIHIYNFAWELIESSNDEREAELFSLADSCSDPEAASVASFKLLLKSDELTEPLSDKALSPSARNLALIASLQFILPITMISNMETRLVRVEKSIKQQKDFYKMVATFNSAAHTRKMVRLINLGRGKKIGSKVMRFIGLSFEDCFHEAAHRKSNLHFGYNLAKKNCLINYEPIVEDRSTNKNKLEGFSLNDSGPLEVYSTQHYVDERLDHHSYWIQQVPGERTKIMGRNLTLLRLQSDTQDLFFTVKNVQKDYGNPNEAAPIDADYTTAGALAGFALLESSRENRRILSLPWNSTNVGPLSDELIESGEQYSRAMNFDQCRAACMADFNCQSFSVCINAGVECVISKTSFRSSKVIEQLANITKSKLAKTSRLVTVKFDDQSSIELARRPNCELRNKNFIELFTRKDDISQNLFGRQAVAARSRTECAEMCFANNLKVLKQDISKVRDVLSALGGYTELQVGGSDENIAQSIASVSEFNSTEFDLLLDNHHSAIKKLCNRFQYLDRQQLVKEGKENYEPQFREKLLVDGEKTLGDEEINGYCLKAAKKNNINRTEEFYKTNFDVEIYDFKADLFYEKQYGVRLDRSVLLRLESDAYHEVKWRGAQRAKPGSMSILGSLIKRGHNFQELIYEYPSECARACFRQMSGPWPACRSFDIVEVGRTFWCLLNSVTLQQIKLKGMTDLILTPEDSRAWHYEPRAGLTQEESLLSGELEFIRGESEAGTLSKHQEGPGLSGSFGLIFIITLAAAACGSILGIWRGKHILASEKGESQQNRTNIDTRGLFESQPIVSYSNQVNPDGEVRVGWES